MATKTTTNPTMHPFYYGDPDGNSVEAPLDLRLPGTPAN